MPCTRMRRNGARERQSRITPDRGSNGMENRTDSPPRTRKEREGEIHCHAPLRYNFMRHEYAPCQHKEGFINTSGFTLYYRISTNYRDAPRRSQFNSPLWQLARQTQSAHCPGSAPLQVQVRLHPISDIPGHTEDLVCVRQAVCHPR